MIRELQGHPLATRIAGSPDSRIAEVAQLLPTGLDGIRCSTSDLWPHLVRLHCGAVLKDACPRQLGEGSAKL